MTSLPRELYIAGFAIAVLNAGLGVWFGGLFSVVSFASAALVTVVCLWSFFGAPGANQLGERFGY